jgi:hypothetical protein
LPPTCRARHKQTQLTLVTRLYIFLPSAVKSSLPTMIPAQASGAGLQQGTAVIGGSGLTGQP